MPDRNNNHVPPPFHQTQYYIAGTFFLICMLMYTFGPTRAAEMVGGWAATFLGFMVGKFTNGFPRSRPTRWDDSEAARGNEEDP